LFTYSVATNVTIDYFLWQNVIILGAAQPTLFIVFGEGCKILHNILPQHQHSPNQQSVKLPSSEHFIHNLQYILNYVILSLNSSHLASACALGTAIRMDQDPPVQFQQSSIIAVL